MESNLRITQLLKGLLVVCRASELGFIAAAEAIPGKITREILYSYADQRREFAEQLRIELRFHAGDWFDVDPPIHSLTHIHHSNGTRNKKEIISQCEQAEEAMMRVYEDALSRKTPWDVHEVLSTQHQEIRDAHHFLYALKQITLPSAA